MHPCTIPLPELPPQGSKQKWAWNLAVDEDCLASISKNYYKGNDAEFKGQGSAGSVVKLIDKKYPNRQIIMKIFPYLLEDQDNRNNFAYQNQVARDATDEVEIGCLLNSLEGETFVFVKALGWLLCNRYPKTWNSFTNFNVEKKYPNVKVSTYMFFFMESAYAPLISFLPKHPNKAFIVDNDEAKVFLFLLTHGLCVARRRFNFHHNDLHEENIMIDISQQEGEDLSYQEVAFDGQAFRVLLPVGRYPKIIDFGKSRTDRHVKPDHRTTNDMFKVLRIFKKYFDGLITDEQFETWTEMGLFSDENNMVAMTRFLLEDLFFDDLRAMSRIPSIQSGMPCSFCGSPAQTQWSSMPFLAFCNAFCANKVSGLANLY